MFALHRQIPKLASCLSIARNLSCAVVLDNEKVMVLQRPVGAFQMNQYLIGCKNTKEAAIIDSGEEPENYYEDCADKLSFNISSLIQTHAHIDHVAGLKPTKSRYPNAPIYMHKNDMPVYDMIEEASSMFGIDVDLPLPPIDIFIEEGTPLHVGDIKFDVLLTPGHSPGSCVFFHDSPTFPFAFVGDLIFEGSVGRTDLPGADGLKMQQSIRRIVKELPLTTLLLPGHMGTTHLAQEIAHNPFVKEWTGK